MHRQIHIRIRYTMADFVGRGIAYRNNINCDACSFASQRVIAIDGEFVAFDFGDDEGPGVAFIIYHFHLGIEMTE